MVFLWLLVRYDCVYVSKIYHISKNKVEVSSVLLLEKSYILLFKLCLLVLIARESHKTCFSKHSLLLRRIVRLKGIKGVFFSATTGHYMHSNFKSLMFQTDATTVQVLVRMNRWFQGDGFSLFKVPMSLHKRTVQEWGRTDEGIIVMVSSTLETWFHVLSVQEESSRRSD